MRITWLSLTLTDSRSTAGLSCSRINPGVIRQREADPPITSDGFRQEHRFQTSPPALQTSAEKGTHPKPNHGPRGWGRPSPLLALGSRTETSQLFLRRTNRGRHSLAGGRILPREPSALTRPPAFYSERGGVGLTRTRPFLSLSPRIPQGRPGRGLRTIFRAPSPC